MKCFSRIQIALVHLFSLVIVTVLWSPPILYAASELPYTFSPGQTISSAQVNANFQTLLTKIQALEAQLTPVSIVGTYDYYGFGTGMSLVGNSDEYYRVMRNNSRGTFTFSANGTVAINGTAEYTSMQMVPNSSRPAWTVSSSTDPDIDTANYTVSGSTVTFGVAIGTLSADGKILVLKYNSPNTTGIVIGIRR